MKIFFLTQFYFDLYKPILKEMERQGHEVYVEEDIRLRCDPNNPNISQSKRLLCRFVRKIFKIETNYWKKKISSSTKYYESYDILLCINGTSFAPYLYNHLKRINKNIKSVLYLWDTLKLYDFLRYQDCFDKVYTFDIDDANKMPGVELMHSYWFPTEKQIVKYKLFIIGSDHDDRIDIISKVYEQTERSSLPSFLRVFIYRPQPPYLNIGHRKTVFLDKLNSWETKRVLPFTCEEKVPLDSVVKYIDESECILDTDMPVQSGVTQRVIWALARGKKIISTNTNLKKYSFYNPMQIKIIDRKAPVIDIEFLKEPKSFLITDEILNLRIDKWINKLLGI